MGVMRWLAVGLVGTALVGAAWLLGFVVGDRTRPPLAPVPQNVEAPAGFPLFGEVWSYVDREYYGDRPAETTISRGAARGLVAGLDDPWAVFLAPDGAEADLPTDPLLLDDLGLWVMAVPSGARVLSILPDSPAAATDLAPGDEIVALRTDAANKPDAADTEEHRPGHEKAAEPIVAQLRDPARASLDIVAVPMDGPAFGAIMTRTLSAAPPSVTATVPEDGVVLIRLPSIDAVTADALSQALADAPRDAASWVVDLRDNPGGDPSALPAIAGHFVAGALYDAVGTDGEPHSIEAEGSPGAPSRLVVLVNAGTVGEAEMLAAALRERAGAILVGATTYGRDALPETVTLADGSRLRLTTAHWTTPEGVRLADGGLVPDEAIADRDDQLAAALVVARSGAQAARTGERGG